MRLTPHVSAQSLSLSWQPMIAHNQPALRNWLGDRVTLLPLRVVSCSQRSVSGANHLPQIHIQVTANAASSLDPSHNVLQASCDFACCIACLWSRFLDCKICWRQQCWQTQCNDKVLCFIKKMRIGYKPSSWFTDKYKSDLAQFLTTCLFITGR